MKVQQQAVAWSCSKPFKTSTTPTIGSSSPFHSGISTLTAAAHRAVFDLFPELAGNCSCSETQGKSHCGEILKDIAASNIYEIARPTKLSHSCEPGRITLRSNHSIHSIENSFEGEQSQSKYPTLAGSPRSGELEEGEAPKYTKREISFNNPTTFFTPPPAVSTMPARPFKV